MGDVYFDLANFAVNNDLPRGDGRALRAYFGAVTAEHERTLTLMRFMSDFREAMWGVVQQALSDLDFDSAAGRHFERLERTAAETAFRRSARLAPGEEDSRSRRRVREQRDRRHDLEGRVHRHVNAYRQTRIRLDAAVRSHAQPDERAVHLARVRVALELVLARDQREVERLLALGRDVRGDVDAARAGEVEVVRAGLVVDDGCSRRP